MKAFLTRLCALVCACALCVCAVCPAGAAEGDTNPDPDTPDPPAPFGTITLSPTSTTLALGKSALLTAVVIPFQSTNYKVTWMSANPNAVTVTPSKNPLVATVTGVAVGSATVYALAEPTKGGAVINASCTVTVQSVPVTGITLDHTTLNLEVGDIAQLSPTLTTAKPTAIPTDQSVDWSSSDNNVATVDALGNVTAHAVGKATIKAVANGSKTNADGTAAAEGQWKSATCAVTVKAASSIKLNVSSLEVTMEDNTKSLTADVKPAGSTVAWSSSDEGVVKVSPAAGTTITLQPQKAGTARVTATANGKDAFCDVTVYAKPTRVTLYNGKTALTSADVLELDLSTAKGKTLTLNARVNDGDGNTRQEVEWASGDSTKVSVQNGKLTALATTDTPVTITANADGYDSVTASVKVKVIQSAEGIELDNTVYTLDLSDASRQKVTLTATLDGTPSGDQKAVSWMSSREGVATVSSTSTTAGDDKKATNIITAVAPGTTRITATTKDGKSAHCDITVVKSPTGLTLEVAAPPSGATVNPGTTVNGVYNLNVDTPVGTKISLKATVEPAAATTRSITWKSGDTKIASVLSPTNVDGGSASTTVTSRNAKGTVTITATAGGKTATCTITYTPIAVTGVKLDKAEATVSANSFINLTATVEPSTASNKSVYWRSSDDTVAKVDAAGNELKKKVTGLKPGTATITVYTVEGDCSASCEVTVTDVPVSGLTITPKDRKFVLPGANGDKTLDLTAILTPKEAKNTVTWTSSDEKVAKVYAKTVDSVQNDKIGVVTMGGTPGEATITATVGDIKDSVTVAVSGVVLEPTSLTLAVREDKYVTRKLYGAALTVSSTDWEWSSSNDKIARVNPTSGQITGVAVGTATITCKNGDYSASIPVTVSANSESVITASLTGGQLNFSSLASRINAQAGGKLSYVTSLSVSPDEGTLYYGYVAEGDTGAGVSASDSFYYSGSGTKKLLGKVIFVPRAGFSGTADISYTAIDSSGDTHPGTVQVTVGAASQISYTCPQGECVYFHSDDFTNYCKGLYGYPIASVRFSTPPAERCGYLYYEYAGGEVFGSNVSAGKRYYSSSTPALDSVSFVPRAEYAGSFTLPYTGWDTAGNSFSGSIRITVTGKAGQAQPGDISYAAHSGKRFYFDAADFADLCRETTGGTLSYVQFHDLGDAYGKAGLYAGISGNSPLYTGRAYYHSAAGSYRLMDVNILPYSSFTGTVTIPFRAYDTANHSFAGRVLVDVTKDSGSADTIYKTSTGMPVSFQRSEFTQACEGQLPGELSSVRFYLPNPSTGVLYAGFSGLNDNRPLLVEEYLPAADLTSLTFVPQGGFSGSAYLNYVARDERNNTCTGTVRVAVWPAVESGYFNDMKSYGWAVSAVDFLRRYGVVTGSTQTTFLPGQAMSRGDFVLMLARAYDLPGAGSRSFPDVPANSYYAQAIASARQRGIAAGDTRGNFNPKSSLSRQEAAVFLYRTMQANGTAVPGSDYDLARFPDADRVAGFAREAMASLAGLGVFQGDGQGRLNPTAPLSRAEMAVILHRAIT